MMMTISSQRARGLGHRAFYLHPEAQVGSGTTPHRESAPDTDLLGTPVPEGGEPAKTGADTGTTSGSSPDAGTIAG